MIKTTNSGDIGIFSAIGGTFLNKVFNSTHFKDVAVVGLINRQFNLNDAFVNLPTSKNNKINWTSTLNYDTSTDTASIDLTNNNNKSEIVNMSNNNSYYTLNSSNALRVMINTSNLNNSNCSYGLSNI